MPQIDGDGRPIFRKKRMHRTAPAPKDFYQVCVTSDGRVSTLPTDSVLVALSPDLCDALKKALMRTPDSQVVLTILQHIGNIGTKSITFEAERGTAKIYKKLGD